MDELLIRAITAYYRTRAAGDDRQVDGQSARVTHLGKGYVVLRSSGESAPLAVYRCMNRGELKRLKRWPPDVVASDEAVDTAAQVPIAQATPALLDLVPVPRKAAPKASSKDLSSANPDQAGLF